MKAQLLKKVVAGIGAVTLLTVNAMSFVVVDAANIPTLAVTTAASSPVTSIVFTPVTALTAGSTIIVGYPATYTDGSLVFGDIAADNAAHDITPGTIVVDIANNTITIPVTAVTTGTSPVTLTLSNGHLVAPASGNDTFSVSTSVGDAGIEVESLGGANAVVVSATVLPTLTMSLDGNSLAFGTLTPSAVTTAQGAGGHAYLGVSLATNAAAGATVTMASANAGKLVDGAKQIPAIGTAITGTAGVEYDTAASTVSSIPDATKDLTSSRTVLDTNNLPTAAATVHIVAKASVSAVTPAGNYSDTLTFTAAGSF